MESTITGKIVTLNELMDEIETSYLLGEIDQENVKSFNHKVYMLCDSAYGVTPHLVDALLRNIFFKITGRNQ